MVKKHKLVFFQLTFIFISLLGYFFSIERPFYFYNQDAEVDYFINSLLVSMGKETWSFHHPGILIQHLGGYVLAYFYNSDPFQANSFLAMMKWILAFFNAVLVALAFRMRGDISKENIFILVLLSFSLPSYIYYLDYFSVDSIVQCFSIVMFLIAWKNLSEDMYLLKDRLLLAGLMSFALSLKMSFAPFVGIIIISVLFKDIIEYLSFKTIKKLNVVLLPISFIGFYLIFNASLIERVPYLVLNTLFEIFLMLYSKKILFGMTALIFSIFCLCVLNHFKAIKFSTFSFNFLSIPKLIFLIFGFIVFVVNVLKVEYSNFYNLGLDLRNASAYFIFFIFPITLFLNQRKNLIMPGLIFALTIFLCIVTIFIESRNLWIHESQQQEEFLKEIANQEVNQDKTLLVWTGSGNNNFLIETFYMWGNYRYSNEQFSDLFVSHFKNIRMIRLRSLPKNNQYFTHNNSMSLIEKISGHKILYPENTDLYNGSAIDPMNIAIVILKGEIQNEMRFQDVPELEFKFFIEDFLDRNFVLEKREHNNISYFIYY